MALDRQASSARDGHLFAQMLVEPDSVFEGTITHVPPGGAELLATAAAGSFFVGRASSAGRGEAKLELAPAPPTAALRARGERFRSALAAAAVQVGIALRVDQCVPLTLLSPLLVTPGDDGSAALAEALGRPVRWLLRARRFGREGGWEQRGTGEPLWNSRSVEAGAVVVAELEGAWTDALAELERIETDGAGSRRHQGCGRILCFDPFITHERTRIHGNR